MSSPLLRRSSALFGLVAFVTVAFAAAKPPVKGVTYRLRMSTRLPAIMAQMGGDAGSGGPLVLAKVKAVGNKARFDFQSAPPGLALDDYVIILDSARAIFVHPEDKTYTDGSSLLAGGGGLGMLSQFAGRRGGGGGRGGRGGGGGGGGGDAGGRGMPSIDISNIVTDLEELDGDTLDGRQVKKYLLVAEMNVSVMGQLAPLRITMEMWTADLPYTIVNPFDLAPVVAADDPASRLAMKLVELRKQVKGTMVKTVTTTTISGLMGGAAPSLEFVQTTAVTDIKAADIDDKELAIPAGYTKKGSG